MANTLKTYKAGARAAEAQSAMAPQLTMTGQLRVN